MSNIEKYKNAFAVGLEVTIDQVEGLKYKKIEAWDSVGHMSLISAIEEAFDITMDTDDIIEFNSYEKGIEILTTNYGVELL